MKTKDVLHLYLGNQIWICNNIEGNPVIENLTPETLSDFIQFNTDYKLILRPISSMTEEEIIKGERTPSFSKWGPYSANDILWLLSKGFDIFNLHASGECLYEEDLTLKP